MKTLKTRQLPATIDLPNGGGKNGQTLEVRRVEIKDNQVTVETDCLDGRQALDGLPDEIMALICTLTSETLEPMLTWANTAEQCAPEGIYTFNIVPVAMTFEPIK